MDVTHKFKIDVPLTPMGGGGGGLLRAALLLSCIATSSVISTTIGRGSYPSSNPTLSPSSVPLPFPLRPQAAFTSRPSKSPGRSAADAAYESERKRARHESPAVSSRLLAGSNSPNGARSLSAGGPGNNATAPAAISSSPRPCNSTLGRTASPEGPGMRSSAGLTLADVRRNQMLSRRPPPSLHLNQAASQPGGGGGTARLEPAGAVAPASPMSPKSRAMQDGFLEAGDNDCPVCAEDMVATMVGRINCNSGHVFCFACIYRWGSECENTCPLCKQSFSQINKLVPAPVTIEGKKLSGESDGASAGVALVAGLRRRCSEVVKVEERKQAPEDEGPVDGEEGCMGCGAGGFMIVCDGCEQGCCMECANMTQETLPPEDVPWFCRDCDDDEGGVGGGRRRRGGGGSSSRAIAEARALGRSYRPRRRGLRTTLDGFIVGNHAEEDDEWAPSSSAERAPLPERPRRSTTNYGLREEPQQEAYFTRQRRRNTNASDDALMVPEGLPPELRRAFEEGRTGPARTRMVRVNRASARRAPPHHVYRDSMAGARRVGLTRPVRRTPRRRRAGGGGNDEEEEDDDSEWAPSREASPPASEHEITLSEEDSDDDEE